MKGAINWAMHTVSSIIAGDPVFVRSMGIYYTIWWLEYNYDKRFILSRFPRDLDVLIFHLVGGMAYCSLRVASAVNP